MKRELFAGGLLLFMIVLSIINIHCLEKITREITENIENCIESTNNGDWEKAEEYAKNAEQKWSDKRTYTSLVLKHDKIDLISDSFSDVLSYIYKEDQVCSVSSSQHLIESLNNILSMEQLKIGTIF